MQEKIAIINKFKEITTAYIACEDVIEEEQKIKKSLELKAQDCHAAARLFGFDLFDEVASFNHSSPSVTTALDSSKKNRTVREFALEEARKAHPNPVRATALRLKLEEERGAPVHEKTVGMTLYRLLKDGLLKRVNRDWFYISEEEKNVFL